MKFVKLFILSFFFCYAAQSQIFQPVATPIKWKIGGFDSLFLPQHDTLKPQDKSKAWMTIKDTAIYVWKLTKWVPISSNGNLAAGTGGSSSNVVIGTVAELRALETTPFMSYISTDRGGGVWKDVGLSDGQYEDDGAVHIITANGRLLERNFSGPINLKWFGAIGNGTANDSAALVRWAAYGKMYPQRHLYIPTGVYKGSYNKPLIFQGDGLVVEGDGAGTNENTANASIILGLVQIGDIGLSDHTTRGQFSNFSIFGPGVSDQTNLTLHKGTGLTIVKAMEAKFTNISIDGFKYGADVYNTPDAEILYAYSITFDQCRFYNNKICNFAWGRVGHSLNLKNCNLSYSDYDIVFGVFDKSVDTLIYGNAEPNLTLNVQGNAIQGWRKWGIVVTSSKKVTIRDNYFENGNTYATSDGAIQLGSKVPTSTYIGTGGGMEDDVMSPIVDGNWFFQMTNSYTYKQGYANIRVVKVNGGSITNNLLNNLPYPVLANDGQLKNTYLIRSDSALLATNISYSGNSTVYGRERTKQYKVVDMGYSSFHGSYTFKFDTDRLPYMNEQGNNIYYKGVKYPVSYLGGGTDQNSAGATFGMTSADILKLPQITPDVPFITDGFIAITPDYKLDIRDTTGHWHPKMNQDLNTSNSPLFVNLSTTSNGNIGGYLLGKSVNGVTGDYVGNTGVKFPKFGVQTNGGRYTGMEIVISDSIPAQVHIGASQNGIDLKGITVFNNGIVNHDTIFKQPDVDTSFKIQVFDQYNSEKWISKSSLAASIGAGGAYTVAGLRAETTTTGSLYTTTNFGGGTWLDAGLNDGQYTDNTGTVLLTANGHALKRQFTGSISSKWFGALGNGSDATAAINKAIAAAAISDFKTVSLIGDTFSIASNINLLSNVKLSFEKGAAIKRLPDNTGSYEILSLNGVKNVEIVDPIIIGDNDAHIGTTGEFGMGIYIVNSKNVTVSNAHISKCWGDGIYIGSIGSDSTLWNDNLQFLGKTVITDCRRQAISVICASNSYIEYLYAKDIIGTAPEAAIDFEPNNSTQYINGFKVGTIEAINTSTAALFVHWGGYTRIDIDKIIDIDSRNTAGDGSYLFLGSSEVAKETGYINIGEITQTKLTNKPLFLFDDWYNNSSPKVTIGTYNLGIWDNSGSSADYKYSVLNHFVSTSNPAQTAIGNFSLGQLRIDSVRGQNGKIFRPYYITGPTSVNQIDFTNTLINYQKIPSNLVFGDGQNVFKTSNTVEIRKPFELVQSIEKKSASFSPADGKQYSITTSVALDLILSGFNNCTLYGLAATPSTVYLVSNVSNSRLNSFVYESGTIDTTGGTPHFLLNPGDKVTLQRVNLTELHVKLVEKTNIPDITGDLIKNNSTGVSQGAQFNINGTGAMKMLTLPTNDVQAFNTTLSGPSVYSTGALGSIPAFQSAGSLVLQSRANADRDIYFVTGSTPTIKGVIDGVSGDLSLTGKVTAGNATASNDLVTLGQSNTNYIGKADLSGRVVADGNAPNSNDFFYLNGANQPAGTTDGALLNYQYNGSYQSQLFLDWRTGRVYARGKGGSSFTAWKGLVDGNVLTDTLNARYSTSTFILRNAKGAGDSIMKVVSDGNEVAMKRLSIQGAAKTVNDTSITWIVGANGTVNFTGNGSTTAFTFVTSSIPWYTIDSKIFITPVTATGAAIEWVEKSTESFTIHFLTAPSVGSKAIDYTIMPATISP